MAGVFFLNDTLQAVGFGTGPLELAATGTQGTPTTSPLFTADSTPIYMTFSTTACHNASIWPDTVSYLISMDVAVAGANITLNTGPGIGRYTSTASTNTINGGNQFSSGTWSSTTGTGIITADLGTLAIAQITGTTGSPAATDIFGFSIVMTTTNTMSGNTYQLNVNSVDSYIKNDLWANGGTIGGGGGGYPGVIGVLGNFKTAAATSIAVVNNGTYQANANSTVVANTWPVGTFVLVAISCDNPAGTTTAPTLTNVFDSGGDIPNFNEASYSDNGALVSGPIGNNITTTAGSGTWTWLFMARTKSLVPTDDDLQVQLGTSVTGLTMLVVAFDQDVILGWSGKVTTGNSGSLTGLTEGSLALHFGGYQTTTAQAVVNGGDETWTTIARTDNGGSGTAGSQGNISVAPVVGTTLAYGPASGSGSSAIVVELWTDTKPLIYVGSSASYAIGVGGLTPTVNASTAVGDLVVMSLMCKYDTATLATPAGWTSLGSGAGTGVAAGNDSGNMKVFSFYRVWQSGDTVLPTLTAGTMNVGMAKSSTYRSVTGAYTVSATFQSDNASTAGASINFTDSGSVAIQSGDILHFDLGLNTDGVILNPTAGTSLFQLTNRTGSTIESAQDNMVDATTALGTDMLGHSYRQLVAIGGGLATMTQFMTVDPVSTFANMAATQAMVVIRSAAAGFVAARVRNSRQANFTAINRSIR